MYAALLHFPDRPLGFIRVDDRLRLLWDFDDLTRRRGVCEPSSRRRHRMQGAPKSSHSSRVCAAFRWDFEGGDVLLDEARATRW